jgi:hypothetical protein
MRTTVQATGATAAESPWVPVSDSQNPFNVGLHALPAQDFAATSYTYQVTPDDPQAVRQATFTTSGTTATVTDTAHGLNTGDSLVAQGTNSSADTYPNAVDITVVDDNTYTYTTGASPPAKGILKVTTMRVEAFGTAVTTGKGFALLQTPCRAVRVKLAGWTVGILNLLVIQAASRTN